MDYQDCINITGKSAWFVLGKHGVAAEYRFVGDVIGTCFGRRDAGSWTIPSLRIFVDFCY